MEHNAIQHGKLIDDVTKTLKAQVAVVLPREQGTRALLAQFVTSAGRFNVDRARQEHPGCSHTNSFIVARAVSGMCPPRSCIAQRCMHHVEGGLHTASDRAGYLRATMAAVTIVDGYFDYTVM